MHKFQFHGKSIQTKYTNTAKIKFQRYLSMTLIIENKWRVKPLKSQSTVARKSKTKI